MSEKNPDDDLFSVSKKGARIPEYRLALVHCFASAAEPDQAVVLAEGGRIVLTPALLQTMLELVKAEMARREVDPVFEAMLDDEPDGEAGIGGKTLNCRVKINFSPETKELVDRLASTIPSDPVTQVSDYFGATELEGLELIAEWISKEQGGWQRRGAERIRTAIAEITQLRKQLSERESDAKPR